MQASVKLLNKRDLHLFYKKGTFSIASSSFAAKESFPSACLLADSCIYRSFSIADEKLFCFLPFLAVPPPSFGEVSS
jgi:hypothetical protein